VTKRKTEQPSATPHEHLPARVAQWVTRWAGSSMAFSLAALLILGWLLSGPFFDYSEVWQLVINTATTIVTFLMVFLIQRAQNKDSHAIHMKLNELVAATQGASNRLINVESLTEDEIKILQEHFAKLAELAQERSMGESHSIEDAIGRHKEKTKRK
jgi:low affinity Fe/Cu permease